MMNMIVWRKAFHSMPPVSYANVLKRSLIYLLIWVSELAVVLYLTTDGQLGQLISKWEREVVFIVTGVVLLLWISVSRIYSCFQAGHTRMLIGGWAGLFWPLPLTLILTLADSENNPHGALYLISDNLHIPLLLVIPTLYFMLTEPGTTKKQVLSFMGSVGVFIAIFTAVCYCFYDKPIPEENLLQQAIEFKVDHVKSTKAATSVKARIINHTDETAILGNCDAIILSHPNKGDFSPCMCSRHAGLPDTIIIPAHSSISLNLVFSRADINYGLWLCFYEPTINGVTYQSNQFSGYAIKAQLPTDTP